MIQIPLCVALVRVYTRIYKGEGESLYYISSQYLPIHLIYYCIFYVDQAHQQKTSVFRPNTG